MDWTQRKSGLIVPKGPRLQRGFVTCGPGFFQSSISPVTYATWNPLDKTSNVDLSSGNTLAFLNGAGLGLLRANIPITGKTYFEFLYDKQASTGGVIGAGVMGSTMPLTTITATGASSLWCDSHQVYGGATLLATLSGAGPIIGCFCIDATTRNVWMRDATGVYPFSGDPVAGTNPTYTIPGSDILYAAGELVVGPPDPVTLKLVADPAGFSQPVPSGWKNGYF